MKTYTSLFILLFLCLMGKTEAQTEIDLSTLQNGDEPVAGCGVDKNNIYFERGGDFILTQSDPNTPTTRYIQTYAACNLILKGINIAVNTASYPALKISEATTLTLSEGTVNRVKTSSPNAAAIDANKQLIIDGTGTLVVEAPYTSESFNGIGIRAYNSLTVNSGTILCNAAGDGIYLWNQLPYYPAKFILNGGTVTTTGYNGLAAYTNEAESITTPADEAQLTAIGKSTAVLNLPDSITAKMMRFTFGYTPATDVTLTVKEGETTVRTITIPVGSPHFAFNTPEGAAYTLWEGDNRLTSDADETVFKAGNAYTLKKNIEVVEIDLSTVTDGEHKGYTAEAGLITLNGTDVSFVLNQSNASAPTARRISAEGKYDITLNGIDIETAEGNAFTVAEGAAVNFLLNEGSVNRLKTTAQGAGLYLNGAATINGQGALVIDATDGITIRKTLDINSGTIDCTAETCGIDIANDAADGRLNINGGNITLTAENGITAADATRESLAALSDRARLTIYARKASTQNLTESATARMMRFAYAQAPETDVTVYANSGAEVMNTLNILSGYPCFAFNAPEGVAYNLWQDNKKLASDADVTDFTTGSLYTGLNKKTVAVTIDLSTVANGSYDGYSVSGNIVLNQRGYSYILNQSEPTVTTNRTISIEADCDVTLNGIDVTGPEEGVTPTLTVEQAFYPVLYLTEGTTNRLTSLCGSSGMLLRGALTINGEGGTLIIDSPKTTKDGIGKGISSLNPLTINGGTIVCSALGTALSALKCTINGCDLTLTGEKAIVKSGTDENFITLSDDSKLTLYAKTDAGPDVPEAILARMMRFALAKASKEETALTVKDGAAEVRNLTVPANKKAFAFTAPANAVYTLWQDGTQLTDKENRSEFSTGNAYTGLAKKETAISTLEVQTERIVNLYTADGRFIRTVRITDPKEAVKDMPHGVYIVEGEKIVK